MFFDHHQLRWSVGLPRRVGRFVGGAALVGALVGGAAVAAHSAAAAAMLGSLGTAVSCATTAACVIGANAKTGPGVSGTSAYGTGVSATGSLGLSASGTTGVKASGSSGYGVQGTSVKSYGVFGSSTGNGGVAGTTPGTVGVYGYTTNAKIDSSVGVAGISVRGVGVYGSGDGTLGTGAYGVGSAIGIDGFSQTGTGVDAESAFGLGLKASSNTNAAVSASTNGFVAIYGKAPNGNGAEISGGKIGLVGRSDSTPLYLSTLNGTPVFYVDGSGNVNYHGHLTGFARTVDGGTVSAYSPKTTQPTVEDTGTARLAGGAAAVRLDPAFAASIDAGGGYRVFLTADGETRGSLYVAAKTPSGFLVRETQGGHSTVSFDYRIVAPALGEAGRRMAVTPGALPIGAPSAPVTTLSIHPAPIPKLPAFVRP